MLNNYFHVNSGASGVMIDEAEILMQKGHDVYFFTTDKKPFYDENYKYKDFFPKYIKYSELNKFDLIKNLFRPFYNVEAEKKLDKLIKEIKPDIVHKHSVSRHLTASVLRACYKNKVPVVMTIHGPTFFCPQEGFMMNETVYCSKELCSRNNFSHFLLNRCCKQNFAKNVYLTALYTVYRSFRLHNGIKKFICPSQAMKNVALRAGIPDKKLEVVNNSCSKSYFDEETVPDNKGYFLYVGRLERVKGIQYLLEAMTKLPEKIKLHIVGEGFEEEYFKNTAKKLNLDNVIFLGYKSKQELEEEYKNCIATILPCRWFETFGLTIIESFLSAKPVIASRMGGIPEIIDNGKNGILIEPGNVNQLVDAMLNLYKNQDTAIKMGNLGRIKAEQQFNPELHYEKLIKVYKSAL